MFREEMETIALYEPIEKRWRVYSTYKPHFKKIRSYATEIVRESEDEIEGYLPRASVGFRKPLKPKK